MFYFFKMKKIIFNLVFVLFLLLSINKSYSDSTDTFNFSFTETDFFVYAKGNNIKNLPLPISDSLLTSLVEVEFAGTGKLIKSSIKEGDTRLGKQLIKEFEWHTLELPPNTKNLSILFKISSNTSDWVFSLEIIKSNIELYNETSLILWREGGGNVPAQKSTNSNLIFYDNFLDMFNNCVIDENKEIVSSTDDTLVQYCNFIFNKRKNYQFNGKSLIYLHGGEKSYWFDDEDQEDEQKYFFESFKKDIFYGSRYDYLNPNHQRFENIPMEMLILSDPDTNKIKWMKLFLDRKKIKEWWVSDTSSDLCFETISKYKVTLSNKHNLKNKWKESSDKIKLTGKNYHNGNPAFYYNRNYTYSLPAKKEIILSCRYIPNINDKNFYWNIGIIYTDSNISKTFNKKAIILPKLNLKIIWKEITKELFS